MSNAIELTHDVRSGALPGPRARFRLTSLWNTVQFFRDPGRTLLSHTQEHGPLFSLTAGDASWLCVVGAAYNQELLKRSDVFKIEVVALHAPKGSAIERLKKSLLFVDGPQHRRTQRLCHPGFSRPMLQRYQQTMTALTDARLSAFRPGQIIDFNLEMRALSLDIAIRCQFGDAYETLGADFADLLWKVIPLLNHPAVVFLPLSVPGSPYYQLEQTLRELERRIERRLHEVRATGDQGHMLAELLRARDPDGHALSDPEVISNCILMIIAGHETTASALAWTGLFLSQCPALARAIAAEEPAEDGLGAGSGRGELLRSVMRESLRLFPPVMYTLRMTGEDTTLGTISVEKGTRIIWSPLASHRDASVYPRPDCFEPERWRSSNPSPFAYVPFGAGPHACIGSAFANMELAIIVRAFCTRFAFTLADDHRIDRAGHITIYPKHGMPLELFDREAAFAPRPVRGNVRELMDFDALRT